jgi:hypothetical protein
MSPKLGTPDPVLSGISLIGENNFGIKSIKLEFNDFKAIPNSSK